MDSRPFPRLAVITMVYNEDVLLPQFLRHYAPQVDTVFLLDNESDDGSIAAVTRYPNVEVSTVPTGERLNDGIQMAAKLAVKADCVGRYDYVLIVDADEFVVPKSGGTLREALFALREKEVFGTHGFHMYRGATEGPYDPAVPLLHQRQWGTESDEEYSKPIIVRPENPAVFCPGFHRFSDRDNDPLKPPSPTHFFLLHYTGIDEDLFVRRCMIRTRRLSNENLKYHWGVQYFEGTEKIFRDRFRVASSDPRAIQVIGPPFLGTGINAGRKRLSSAQTIAASGSREGGVSNGAY